jgi:hypothetical protein
MAIINLTQTLVDAYTWELSWASTLTSPTYRIYVDGVRVSVQTQAVYRVMTGGAWSPVVEILDDPDEVPKPAFPGAFVLGWETDPDAWKYRIERKVDGTWTEYATLLCDQSKGWQSYSTPVLSDGVVHEWRIVPVDAAGNDGTAVEFTTLMVRYPDVPAVTHTYNGALTRTVTITAA